MLGGRRASRGVGRSVVECVEILEGQLSHVITIAMAHAQHGPFVWRTRRLWRRATHGSPPPATTPRGRLSWLPPLTFFFFSVDTSTRRSRVGWGDTGPGPLVALHGTPQRESNLSGTAGPLPEVGLRDPWFALHGHELAACAAMGYPMSLSRYLDPYPVLFHAVCLCLNLTHSRTLHARTGAGRAFGGLFTCIRRM